MDVYGNFNPHYVSEQARLDSFRDHWKYSHITADELALNGFFNKFRDDFVTCWFCNITIGKFEVGDIIREEHRKWSPDCALVRGDFIVNYPIDQKRWKMLREENSLIHYRKKLSESRNNTLYNPFYEELSTVKKRLSTFTFWPSSFEPIALAEAGLFYTNKSDNCKCKFFLTLSFKPHNSQISFAGFSCCGEIANFNADSEPSKMHAEMYPECLFVKKLLKAFSPFDDGNRCMRCEINEKDMICEPCNHLAFCNSCKNFVDNCAYCSEKCTSFKKMFPLESVEVEIS